MFEFMSGHSFCSKFGLWHANMERLQVCASCFLLKRRRFSDLLLQFQLPVEISKDIAIIFKIVSNRKGLFTNRYQFPVASRLTEEELHWWNVSWIPMRCNFFERSIGDKDYLMGTKIISSCNIWTRMKIIRKSHTYVIYIYI